MEGESSRRGKVSRAVSGWRKNRHENTKKQTPFDTQRESAGKIWQTAGLGFLLDALHCLGETGNLAGGFFPVNGALAGALVQHGSSLYKSGFCLGGIFFRYSQTHGFDDILDAGTGGTVASRSFQALLVSLDGGSMIGQGNPSENILQ